MIATVCNYSRVHNSRTTCPNRRLFTRPSLQFIILYLLTLILITDYL